MACVTYSDQGPHFHVSRQRGAGAWGEGLRGRWGTQVLIFTNSSIRVLTKPGRSSHAATT